MIESRFLNQRNGNTSGTQVTSNLQVAAANEADGAKPRVRALVIGCRSVEGANMARFLKLWAGQRMEVTLVEPECDASWASAPAVEGSREGFSEYFPYDPHRLEARYGVHVIGACVVGIDPYGRALTLADGSRICYDRLEVAPGARLNGSRIAVAA